MDLFAWFDLFKQQLKEADAAQWAVLILGVTEVLLAKANKIWLYPAGIAATILSVYGLFQAQLYAESFLNVYYLVMSIYGWWYWVAKKNEPPVRITHASAADWKLPWPQIFGSRDATQARWACRKFHSAFCPAPVELKGWRGSWANRGRLN